jgi:alkaline phosphatase
MPYSLDLSNDDDLRASTPTLSEMMTKALALLGDGDARVVLQVEAGRVDHGAHGNDPAATLFDQLEFDRCIAIARAFAERRGDTLVIITTDHGTGGFMLNGYGVEYSQSSDCFKNLRLARASFEYILDVLGENPEPTMVADALRRGLALELTPAQLEHVMQAFRPSVGAAPVDFLGVDINLGLVLRPILLNFYAVSWTTQNHTADHAELASFGPGSEAIPTWLENWELHQHLRNALAI